MVARANKGLSDLSDQQEDPFCGKQAVRRNRKEKSFKNGHLSIETCILPYGKQIASPGSLHEAGCPGLAHWDDPEGWDREGGSGWGTQVLPWWIHVNVWQKPLRYCKVTSLQLK